MAAGWERELEWMWNASRPVGEWLVAKLDPHRGQTVLELAAGTGETGFAAAERLGPGGRLICSDFAFGMIQAAQRRAEHLGLQNVEFRIMDAEHMDLDDNSVDGVLCRFGYMLMSDPAAALAETRRVLRPGGRLALSVWGDPPRNPWALLGGGALVQHGHMPMPSPDEPGIFAMANEERIEQLVTGAGFATPEIEEVPVEWHFDDFEGYWNFLGDLAGGIAMVLATLTDEQRAQVRDTIEQNAQAFRQDDGGYVLPGVAVNAVAS
jgi:SAM-dependent methyltransferase